MYALCALYRLTCCYDFFTYGGAWAHQQPGFTGSGAWCCLHQSVTSASTSYLSSGNYVATTVTAIPTRVASAPTSLTPPLPWQLFYEGENWTVLLLAQVGYSLSKTVVSTSATPTLAGSTAGWQAGELYSVAAAAWWKPEDSGLIPSISTGLLLLMLTTPATTSTKVGTSASSGLTSSSTATPSVAPSVHLPTRSDDDDNTMPGKSSTSSCHRQHHHHSCHHLRHR